MRESSVTAKLFGSNGDTAAYGSVEGALNQIASTIERGADRKLAGALPRDDPRRPVFGSNPTIRILRARCQSDNNEQQREIAASFVGTAGIDRGRTWSLPRTRRPTRLCPGVDGAPRRTRTIAASIVDTALSTDRCRADRSLRCVASILCGAPACLTTGASWLIQSP